LCAAVNWQPKPDAKQHLLADHPKVDDFTVERDRDTGRDYAEVFDALDAAEVPDFEEERDHRPPEERDDAESLDAYHRRLIEEGIRQADAGEVVGHEAVRERLRQGATPGR
jgi:hypothetical protein